MEVQETRMWACAGRSEDANANFPARRCDCVVGNRHDAQAVTLVLTFTQAASAYRLPSARWSFDMESNKDLK